ncbi:Flagellar hook-associated protein FliD [hydrothermal vent metagenome]|uniref:Filament cap protein n=1 Tax=hydrothermal vent metagenome TaxID=652676 RepID=A0A3B1C0V3_9ZZZZ
MAFAVDGLVSGLDTTSIISQLINLERRPITLLENKQVTLGEQRTAWQEVSKRLLSFESSAKAISTSGTFAARTGKFNSSSSTGGSVLSLITGSDVSAGSYNIVVSQLADAEKSTSNAHSSSTTALGASGTITIDGPAGITNVTVNLTDTLNDIRDNINNSGASATVTVIDIGTSSSPSYRLVVTGNDTGSTNSFTITDATDGATDITFTENQAAQDATFTIDNISVTKDSNTVTGVISGATINLETIGSGAISFTNDTSGTLEKIQTFVDSYNDVMDYIREQFTYDQSKDSKGALFGNVSLETIQSQLRSIVSDTVPGIDTTDSSNLSALSQVGILTNSENKLEINVSKLTDMLVDRFSDVQDLFVPSGSGTYTFVNATGFTQGGTYATQVVDDGSGNALLQLQLSGSSEWISLTQSGNFALGQNDTALEGLIIRTGTITINDTGSMRIAVGVAQSVATYTSTYTEFSAEGLIFNQNDSIKNQDREIQKQIDDLEERVAKKGEDLRTKFANLETLLAKLVSEQSYLDSQLANLSKGWK